MGLRVFGFGLRVFGFRAFLVLGLGVWVSGRKSFFRFGDLGPLGLGFGA